MEKIPSISSEINKVEVNKFIFNNFNSISPYFYKLISEWMSDAYKIFKDKKENKVLEEIIFQNEIGRIRDIQIQPVTGKIFILTTKALWKMERSY